MTTSVKSKDDSKKELATLIIKECEAAYLKFYLISDGKFLLLHNKLHSFKPPHFHVPKLAIGRGLYFCTSECQLSDSVKRIKALCETDLIALSVEVTKKK